MHLLHDFRPLAQQLSLLSAQNGQITYVGLPAMDVSHCLQQAYAQAIL
jgi:hypothetical protein